MKALYKHGPVMLSHIVIGSSPTWKCCFNGTFQLISFSWLLLEMALRCLS